MPMINQKRLVSLFKRLVETDSPSASEQAVCSIIKKELKKTGAVLIEDNAKNYINGNAGNLYTFIKGDLDLPPVLFSAHMDTVEPSKNKKCIIEDDGKIHSDGTTVLGSDDFAGISAIIESVKVIMENKIPHRPIELIFSVSEETYCSGIKNFDFSKIQSKDAYVFDLSGKVGNAAYAAPTIISFKAEIHGKASHAGFAPEQGIHSIKAAADAVSKITCGKIDDETTVNIGIISGGKATNIVPDFCVLKGEIRSYSDKKAVAEYEKIENIVIKSAKESGASAYVSFDKNVIAYETDINSKTVKRFKDACADLQLKSNIIRSFGGSDNNVFAQHGINGIVTATAMNDCHTLGEWTTIDELTKAAELALNLMLSKE